MPQTFSITRPAIGSRDRLFLIAGGVALLALGLVGLVRGGAILLGVASVETFQSAHVALGTLITLAATGLGGAMIWACLIPERTVIFDATTQQVRVTDRYLFGFRREATFAMADLRPPEVIWVKDQEVGDGGYWALQVTLPDGRRISKSPDAVRTSDQKAIAEEWLGMIQQMRR